MKRRRRAGGRLNLSHAGTHSVILPHVVALNASAVPEMVARLKPVLGPSPAGTLWRLAKSCGLPTDLTRLGARTEHLREVAENVAPVGRVDLRLGQAVSLHPVDEVVAGGLCPARSCSAMVT